MTDDDVIPDDAPFMLILYKFLKGAGYSVDFMEDVPLGQVSIENMADMLDEYLCSGEILPSYIISVDPETGETVKSLENTEFRNNGVP